MPDLPKICSIVAEYYYIYPNMLYVIKHKKGNLPREIATYLATELSSLKFKIISDFLKTLV